MGRQEEKTRWRPPNVLPRGPRIRPASPTIWPPPAGKRRRAGPWNDQRSRRDAPVRRAAPRIMESAKSLLFDSRRGPCRAASISSTWRAVPRLSGRSARVRTRTLAAGPAGSSADETRPVGVQSASRSPTLARVGWSRPDSEPGRRLRSLPAPEGAPCPQGRRPVVPERTEPLPERADGHGSAPHRRGRNSGPGRPDAAPAPSEPARGSVVCHLDVTVDCTMTNLLAVAPGPLQTKLHYEGMRSGAFGSCPRAFRWEIRGWGKSRLRRTRRRWRWRIELCHFRFAWLAIIPLYPL